MEIVNPGRKGSRQIARNVIHIDVRYEENEQPIIVRVATFYKAASNFIHAVNQVLESRK